MDRLSSLSTATAFSLALSAGCASGAKTENTTHPFESGRTTIGDGEHCTDSIDQLNLTDLDRRLIGNVVTSLSENLRVTSLIGLASETCPNNVGIFSDNEKVYVYEMIDGTRHQIDPLVHFALQLEGKAAKVEK